MNKVTEPGQVKIDFLEGVASFLRGTLSRGRLGYCAKHRIGHTGKICYLSVVDLALYRLTGCAEYLEEGAKLAVQVAGKLGKDPRSGTMIFLPGALDHRNAANHAIDSGAAVDCLATMLLEGGEAFSEPERAQVTEAVEACATTYLKEAARSKQIPAQRLWAGTGLAAAHALLGDPSYREAALESLRLLHRDAYPDGAIPYFPTASRMGVHSGQEDVTSYYHSRCIGFAFYILERLGEEPTPELAPLLERALDFLAALYSGQGLKICLNEAKQWYWDSPYEVASHSFDVHALVAGHRVFKRRDLLDLAALSFARLDQHRLRDGGIHSHAGKGMNFQCRLFWNSHAAWVARVIDDLPLAPRQRERKLDDEPRIHAFPAAGLVKVETPVYEAIFRGAKKPINISFGSEVGGGSLAYLGFAGHDFIDCLGIGKWASHIPGSYTIYPARLPPLKERIREFLEHNRSDVKFKLYVTWMEFFGGRYGFAFSYPFRHILARFRDELKGCHAAHWDCATTFTLDSNRLVFEGAPARRSGKRLEGASIKRSLLIGKDRIEVEDELQLPGGSRKIIFPLIPEFQDLQAATDCPHISEPSSITFRPGRKAVKIHTQFTICP